MQKTWQPLPGAGQAAALSGEVQEMDDGRFPNADEVLDRAATLEQLDGDEELLADVAALFLEECPRFLSAIQRAVERGEAKALMNASHALKGSVGNFAAKQAFEAALRLEMMGREGNLALAASAYGDLAQALETLKPALAALARTKSAPNGAG